MDWTFIGYIIVGMVALGFICFAIAVIEGEFKKRREDTKWDEWVEKEKRRPR